MIRLSSLLFLALTLLFLLQVAAVVKANSEDQLVRKKREWILPPKPLTENVDYTKKKSIAKIRSDFETTMTIEYFLEGPGVSQPPYDVFEVNRTTGDIIVKKILDREEVETYTLLGIAKSTSDGKEKETRLGIRIQVVDQNDNAPVFQTMKTAEVMELRAQGTAVMKLNATDRDKEGTDNSKIAYSIISQSPNDDMFYVTKDGTVCIKKDNLDREKHDRYTLTVVGSDLYGKPGGLSGTGTLTIDVLDVNDNPPTLEKETYEGSIDENTEGVEVMRLKSQDLDQKGTENWEAVYEIVKGNEAGYFSFKTDPKTNEGILMLDKAVDYEDVKDLDLGITVRNKAPFFDGSGGAGAAVNIGAGAGSTTDGNVGVDGTTSGGSSSKGETKLKTYPLKIKVNNMPEGPAFDPKVKTIPISEGGETAKINDVIATYPAIDGDTRKPAEKVRYLRGSDPDNWLTIDPKTAEIRLNKIPDRESPYLLNGTYIAKVLCISEDKPGQTATGTVAIQVEDFNDHCPELTSTFHTMCTEVDSIIARAEDKDAFPNGAPFNFIVLEDGTEGKWKTEHLNGTAAIIRAQETMWPGIYKVAFEVKDAQGKGCSDPQKVDVRVCTCDDRVTCTTRNMKRTSLGPAGIGMLFLGMLLLLLLLLLLLFCHCGAAGIPGGFTEMPFDTKSHLINYRTEGQGENTEVPLMNMTHVDAGVTRANVTSTMAAGPGFHQSVATMDRMNAGVYEEGFYGEGAWGTMNQGGVGGFCGVMEHREEELNGGFYDGMALPDHLLAEYYTQKLASGNENLAVEDELLVHDYEGQGSLAGSVGSCGLLESDNDLQFLDDLGPKFKTLAEVCGGKKIQTEVKPPVFTPPPRPSINTQSLVSSVVTSQQLPPVPRPQLTIPKTERTVVKETVKESTVREGMSTVSEGMSTVREGMSTVRQGMSNQGQMILLPQQQPVYYTTTPMLQPMQYVVQPQVQSTVLLAGAPANNLQGMVLVNGSQTVPAQGMVYQGQTMMSTAQAQGPGMVLVGGSGVQGGAQTMMSTAQAQGPGMVLVGGSGVQGGAQTMMVVEGKVPAGSLKVLKGGQTTLVQGGTLPAGGLVGSQRVRKSSSTTTTVSTTPTYRKEVVQETREVS